MRVELDVCGAWVMLANAGGWRPVVVRRAGWVDLRGHPVAALGTADDDADDRVGLGPGDALVAVRPPRTRRLRRVPAPADDAAGLALLDALLPASGVAFAPHALEAALTIQVPETTTDAWQRQVDTVREPGADNVAGPRFPLGDRQPDLWSQPPRPPRVARFRLDSAELDVRDVRALLRRMLASWRIDALVEGTDVELLGTELVTNALLHAGTPATITVRYEGDRVRVEVRDPSSTPPRPRTPRPDRVGGRGLWLVERLAHRWGTRPDGDGKVVWFEARVHHPPER
jgi:anti-sigma regulatory factor (Ser/Thr protein kinase)